MNGGDDLAPAPVVEHDVVLDNGNVRWRFQVADRATGMYRWLERFLWPAFQPAAVRGGAADVTLRLEPYERFPEAWAAAADQPRLIRWSSKDAFHLRVDTLRLEAGRLAAVDRAKRTAFLIDETARTATAYVSEMSGVHLVEFVRYAALLFEEHRGTVLLHASAALGPRGTVLVVGEKGAGKTTTLLDLVRTQGLQFYSGDKVLLRRNGRGLELRPWPDYPHIGMGTLRQYPDLMAAWGVGDFDPDGRRKADGDKELIDPLVFRDAVQVADAPRSDRLAAVLLPEISAATAGVARVDDDPRACLDLIHHHIEHPSDFTPARWHAMFDDIARGDDRRGYDRDSVERLLAAPWYRVTGGARPPAEALA